MNMNMKIIALALFVTTASAIAFYPTPPAPEVQPVARPLPNANLNPDQRPVVEVVFALDTTGSMGGLIQAAKEKIWSIATSLATAQPAPRIRIGLVAYRDRGDDYVTRVVDLTEDLDSLYATLMDFQAQGGGDGPESVNQALHDAVHRISWGQEPNAYRVVFLVGDAPPHMDYPNDVQYPDTIAAAQKRGILINAIQCGQDRQTTGQWQRIAQLGRGSYFQVEQAGNAVAIATPFDKKLADLSAKLDETRLYYGNAEEKAKHEEKLKATDKLHAAASVESRARRAAFNVSGSGKANLLGEGELVDDVASGRVDLSHLDKEQLPAPMQAMAPEAQQALIKEKAERRNEVQRQVKELAQQREEFLKQQVKEADGAKDSLDHKIFSAVREQAAPKGLSYQAGALAY